MRRKIISCVLVFCMVIALSPLMGYKAEAASFKYDANAALEYAKKHVNDSSQGECAEFVSRCVIAGGIKMSVQTGTGPCYRAIGNAIGIDLGNDSNKDKYNQKDLSALPSLILDSKGYAKKSSNEKILSAGDVVIQWCYTCHISPHILICSGYDSNGNATFYARNNVLNNKTYNFKKNSQHKDTCNIGAKVIHFEVSRTVTFNANGGTVSPTSSTVTNNTAVGKLPTPTRSGYAFNGWYTDKTGGTKISATTIITGNKTYYAQWTIRRKVTFNANGGSVSPTSKLVTNNTAVGSLPTPARSGCVFRGWYTAKKGGTKISTTTKITANKTYYAQWTIGRKVTFNANGGTVSPTSKLVTNNTAVGSLPTPTRSGYAFNGWYTAKKGGTKISATTKITGNKTYYAQWTIRRKVTFNANGGSVSPTSKLVTNNTAVGSLPTPTRSGYAFNGWYTAKTGGTKITTTTKITGNKTYYARWKTAST